MHAPARPFVVVIDPAVQTPEVECLNLIAELSELPVKYHLPALYGPGSLPASPRGIAGLVVMGSRASVHDNLEWQAPMNAWLKPLVESGIPTLGICYGHQLLAHLFGGSVDFVFADRKKHLGFRKVYFDPTEVWSGCPQEGNLFVSHCEAVKEVPACFEVVARSPEISVEAMAHRTLPVWSLQPHPEAGPHFARRRNLSYVTLEEAYGFGHRLVKAFLDLAARRAR